MIQFTEGADRALAKAASLVAGWTYRPNVAIAAGDHVVSEAVDESQAWFQAQSDLGTASTLATRASGSHAAVGVDAMQLADEMRAFGLRSSSPALTAAARDGGDVAVAEHVFERIDALRTRLA